MKRIHVLIAITLLFIPTALKAITREETRKVTRLEEGWFFHKGEDGEWEKVTIPHDWAITGPFDRENDLQVVAVTQNFETEATEKTGRSGGLPYMGIGWYKRSFDVSLENTRLPGTRRAILYFDGAMSNARVYVNGKEVIYWPYGYNAFHVDVTPYLTPDGKNNELTVRLENAPQSSRWYPGAGLYRDVYLIETNEICVPVWGSCITTTLSQDLTRAQVRILTKINESRNLKVEVATSVFAPDGTVTGTLTSSQIRRINENQLECEQIFAIDSPMLWSPETPSLYRAESSILVTPAFTSDGPQERRGSVPAARVLADVYSTTFGIRSIEVRPETGFYLNGKNRKFKGVCLHHDLGPLGAAVNESAIRHQLTMLKDMGCDAIRTTHNMPASILTELCDSMGFMVMIENFDEWDVAKCDNGYHLYFEEWAEKDMVNMLHHFRNHPSVVMWSIGNEVPTQWMEEGYKVATFLRDICHREDPTRPVTCGMDQVDAILANGFGAIMDVPGFNYRVHKYLEGYEKLPQKVLLGSETASTVSSRGVYHLPAEKCAGKLTPDHQCSSYDLEHCWWSNIPDDDFALAEDYPWTMGQFVWTGFDYLGEPSPYDTDAWPNHSSMFGIIDLASIPKDRYYLYRSIWNEESPTLHILPHWNWEGKEGETIPVFVYTSYPAAELFINGKSMGIRRKSNESNLHRYRLMWFNTKYEPGEITVNALDDNSQVVMTRTIRTASEPYSIVMEPSRTELNANGKDLCYITVKVVDKKGNLCPLDERSISFDVKGAGSFKAVANGDPTSLELFHIPQMKCFGGMMTLIVSSSQKSGKIKVTARAKGVRKSSVELTTK